MINHLRLEPLGPTDANIIEIGEQPFLIGRNEPPFDSLPRDMVESLSRRHASITRQAGHYYLQDLGSTNGTALNGTSLAEQARPIANGDRIQFGKQLCFRAVLTAPPNDEDETGLLDVRQPQNSTQATVTGPAVTDSPAPGAASKLPASQIPGRISPGRQPDTPVHHSPARWFAATLLLLLLAGGYYLYRGNHLPGQNGLPPAIRAPSVSLTTELKAALQQDDLARAQSLLEMSTKRTSEEDPIIALNSDLVSYRNLLSLEQENRPLELAIALKQHPWKTALFREQAAQHFATGLPPNEVVERYLAIDQAWRDGELIEAIDGARRLSGEPWGEYADQRLTHYKHVLATSERLRAMDDGEAYQRELAAFQRELDPERDRFFHQQLARELDALQQQVPATTNTGEADR